MYLVVDATFWSMYLSTGGEIRGRESALEPPLLGRTAIAWPLRATAVS